MKRIAAILMLSAAICFAVAIAVGSSRPACIGAGDVNGGGHSEVVAIILHK